MYSIGLRSWWLVEIVKEALSGDSKVASTGRDYVVSKI
jgi:hypothetical protein